MNSQTLVFLGRSGSGKGTQVDLIRKNFEPYLYISTGALFRDTAKLDSFAGKKIKISMESGGLPPEWLASFLWEKELIEKFHGNENLILDGTPRRLPEAEELDRVLEWLEVKEGLIAILVDITEEEAMNRLLKRSRIDDSKEGIISRLSWFKTSTEPVIDYYEKSGRLVRIDGMGTVEEIHERIKKALNLP
jgi:adenylate kinase